MIRKAIISLAAVFALALALGVSTGHAASHHSASAAQARAALIKYLRTYSPTARFPAGLKPGEKRTGPQGAVGAAPSGGVTKYKSFNWGGYVTWKATAQTYTKITGSWKVPKATCTAEDRFAAIWVGIDGFQPADPTVEQEGTLDWCFEGKAHYFTWYEMYPNSSVDVGTTVAAGDAITATVTRSGTSYNFKMTDATHTKNSFSKTKSCALTTCLDESAEWIIERPALAIGITPLAQIASVTVSKATDTANGASKVISKSPQPSSIQIFDGTQTYALWNPTSLSSAGNSFGGTWKNSY